MKGPCFVPCQVRLDCWCVPIFVTAGLACRSSRAVSTRACGCPHLEEKVDDSAPDSLEELYRVQKMRFKSKDDRSTIVYNSWVTVSGVPERAYRYQLGARSAIEWIIDRYQVKTDKASGIVNDPNDWSEDPRYIVDLLGRIVTVSLETLDIVEKLPPMEILDS